ncbi:MAG: hypothetical protein LBQ79_06435 [Deltaproteobacteria bacterium]|jgi:hypothetical protein|nr:hypothetical protein [Deltaproteobacteria bacterium]
MRATNPILLLFASCALAIAGVSCAHPGGAGTPPDPLLALVPPPPVPGLSEASETVYAAVFRARTADGRAAAGMYVKEPDLLRPLAMDRVWEGEVSAALAAAALSIGWKLRCAPGLGRARVRLGKGMPGTSWRVLELLMEIRERLAESGETLGVDVFTRTFTVERSGE